jgi:hypothetical protein
MADIKQYYSMVDNVISSLGVDPNLCRGEKEGQWSLTKGSASVWIDVWQADNGFTGYLQIMAPVVQIPGSNREAFFREVLDINHTLYGVGMTAFGDWIYMKTVRELDGLDQAEATAMFNRVGGYADDYDDMLREKYWQGSDRR